MTTPPRMPGESQRAHAQRCADAVIAERNAKREKNRANRQHLLDIADAGAHQRRVIAATGHQERVTAAAQKRQDRLTEWAGKGALGRIAATILGG